MAHKKPLSLRRERGKCDSFDQITDHQLGITGGIEYDPLGLAAIAFANGLALGLYRGTGVKLSALC